MFEKLSAVESRYEQIGVELTRPEIVSDNAQFTRLMKEHSELTPIVEKYREYMSAVNSEKEAAELLEAGGLDKDFKELVEAELLEAKENKQIFADELKLLLLPKDPNDDKNVIVEIRGAQAVRRQRCLLHLFIECTLCMPKVADGILILPT